MAPAAKTGKPAKAAKGARAALARWKEKFGAGVSRPRGVAGMGYPNYSVVSQNAPISGGGESVVAFNADTVVFLKNDGAVDVLIAFDTPAGPASTTRKPITLKAGEVMSNLPFRTANIAMISTGAASAVRAIGLF
jgi:hypothetical protein